MHRYVLSHATIGFLGKVQIDHYNSVSYAAEPRIWEKNWLFFEKGSELYMIYSTTPRYIVYKCSDFSKLRFEKCIDIQSKCDIPADEYYFTANYNSEIKISTGGSVAPICLGNKYIYMIHTKITQERKYNHYLVELNTDLTLHKIHKVPLFSKDMSYHQFFPLSMIWSTDNKHIMFSGGIDDSSVFVCGIELVNLSLEL
jgi:hypothetical protein